MISSDNADPAQVFPSQWTDEAGAIHLNKGRHPLKVPADLYSTLSLLYLGLPEIDYLIHGLDIIVTNCGRACLYRKKINISTVLAGQKPGPKQWKTASGSSA